jgi:hypothetical protein
MKLYIELVFYLSYIILNGNCNDGSSEQANETIGSVKCVEFLH